MQAAVLAPSQDPQPTPLFPELGPIADEPDAGCALPSSASAFGSRAGECPGNR